MKSYESYHERKAHTSPEFPYNTYLCSIPLDFMEVPMHWHTEAEIVVVKKGTGVVHVDLVPHNVEAGDMVLILPGQLHAIAQKGQARMEYENILFKKELLASSRFDLCSSSFLEPFFAGGFAFSPHIHKEEPYYETVSKSIEEIDALCGRRPQGYQLAVKGYLFQIIFQIVTGSTLGGPEEKQKNSLEKMKRVLAYMHENYQRAISIEEIAKVCHYSKSHFMKFFKESMGMGFIQYLNDYRLSVASQMLLSGAEGILEVAQGVGFENLSYFNRLFKRKYGVTPGQFRRQ